MKTPDKPNEEKNENERKKILLPPELLALGEIEENDDVDDEVTESPYAELDDETIIEMYRGGDLIAQEFLISKYKNFVRSKARSYFLIGADKEDIIQEGMIGLYKAIRDYRDDKQSSFRAFADLCITRQIITAIKTVTRQK
ncbi:MAG: sigma-70 family RNA polymerase sigma factor, partial [Clostridia bacterium]